MKKLLLVGSIFFVIPLILIILISVYFDERVKTVESFQKPDTLKYCNSLTYEKNINLHPEKFSAKINLGLAFESERAWKRNLLNSLIRSEKNRKESDNWRLFSSKSKRQKGYIFLDIPGKLKCKIEARIREHGDLMDQRDGTLLPSLNVHLVNGHIFGIKKYLL